MGEGTNLDKIQIRPIGSANRTSSVGCGLLLAGTLLAVVALRLGLPHPYGWGLGWWALVPTALPVALVAAQSRLTRRNLTLIAGPDYLTRVDWLGRHRTFHRREIAAVLTMSVIYGRGRPMPQVFVVGAGNRRLMLLLPWMWSERELDELWRQAGIQPQGRFEDVETAAQLAARLPDLIPAWRANPAVVPLVATVLVLAFALILFYGAPGFGDLAASR